MTLVFILIITFIIIELCIFLIIKKNASLKWIVFNKKIKFERKKFRSFIKNSYDFKLGWDYKFKSKKKKFITKKGFRKSDYSNRNLNTIAFGDSYTYCRELEYNKTWCEIISKKKNIFVANYGVGNYGLDQAFLKFSKLKTNNKNKIVIFGFVPETICRIQSSWKNYIEFGNVHGFKPCVKLENNNLKFNQNPLSKNDGFANLNKIIDKINKTDRFYKEKFLKYNFSFPYLFSFIKNLSFNFEIFTTILFSKMIKGSSLENKVFPIVMKHNIKFSHNLYNDKVSQEIMKKLFTKIRNKAKKKNLKCYFVIIPQLFDLKLSTRKKYQTFYERNKNFNVIDLTKIFLKENSLKNCYTNDKYGGHLNKFGTSIVAKEIIKIIYK